ncbi:MAG: tyrosine-protein phosphatase [Arenicellales bacterium]|nr:tyrosine-protein phosphatase [Arenicellales bacterium]
MAEREKVGKAGNQNPYYTRFVSWRMVNCSAADNGRHIELDGQPNFRDLGGYKTTDGRQQLRKVLLE